MGFIDWNDNFKLGVPSMDADHRRMAELLNLFCAAADRSAPSQELSQSLTRLIDETERHFKREEELLDQLHYPELPYHRLEHQRLMAQLRHFHGRLQIGQVAREHGIEMADWLRRWLFEHIQGEDKAYRPFVMRLA